MRGRRTASDAGPSQLRSCAACRGTLVATVANLRASCGIAMAASVCYRTLAALPCHGDAVEASGASRCLQCALPYGRRRRRPATLSTPNARTVEGARPLARKRSSVTPKKRRRAPAATPPPSTTLPQRAHSQLIHGFLVRIAKPMATSAGPAVPAPRRSATTGAGTRPPAPARHDGPPDAATFH